MNGMTVRDAVLQLLRSFGMQRIFGNPGSTELPLFLDFPADFEYVLGLQESVVVGMADGYATATNNAAFVNLHSAVGVGHAMGAIFTAWKNRTPLVISAGQQARSLFPFDPFLFSAQATELPKPYVKWSCEPARAEDVPQAIAHGYYLAMQPPRGPVLVSIPSDDWARACAPVEPRRVSLAPRCDAAVLAAIGAALDASERPAFVVGAGVDRGGAWDEVRALAERHRARVFTAPMSARCGFAEDHPQFAGFLPAMRERIVAALAGSDLVLVLGAPAFTYHVEGHGPHVPAGAVLCQITDDAEHRRARAHRHCRRRRPARRGTDAAATRGAARAACADGSAGAAACRGVGADVGGVMPCRPWRRFAIPTTSSSKRRRARAR